MEEKKKLKISIFDVIIVAVVAVVAVVLFMMFKPDDVDVSLAPTNTIQYTVELQKMPEGTTELIRPGDAVKESTKNYAIGNVVSATAIPYTVQSADESTGEVKNAVLDRYENIEIVVEVEINVGGSKITTAGDDYQIAVGTKVYFAGPCYAGEGYITALEREA